MEVDAAQQSGRRFRKAGRMTRGARVRAYVWSNHLQGDVRDEPKRGTRFTVIFHRNPRHPPDTVSRRSGLGNSPTADLGSENAPGSEDLGNPTPSSMSCPPPRQHPFSRLPQPVRLPDIPLHRGPPIHCRRDCIPPPHCSRRWERPHCHHHSLRADVDSFDPCWKQDDRSER